MFVARCLSLVSLSWCLVGEAWASTAPPTCEVFAINLGSNGFTAEDFTLNFRFRLMDGLGVERSLGFDEGGLAFHAKTLGPGVDSVDIRAQLQSSVSFAENFHGTTWVDFEVADPSGSLGSCRLDIVVSPLNDGPRVEVEVGAHLSVVEGQTVTFRATAIDPEGDAYEWVLWGDDEVVQRFNPDTGTFSWTPTWRDLGSYVLFISTRDVHGEDGGEADVHITVERLDADSDGLSDHWESEVGLDPTTIDTDGDSIADGHEAGTGEAPRDTDYDGTPDALDLDSDDDGLTDADEAGDADPATAPATALTGGFAFQSSDQDGDGILDGDDRCPSAPDPEQVDRDEDGLGDICEDDADYDGALDALEPGLGLDPLDPDTDDDGIADGAELGPGTTAVDTDGDLTIDALDEDSDGDGLSDASESGDDLVETPPIDTDGDGAFDFQDMDSDGDTLTDDEDGCPLDADPDQIDRDEDGIGDACDPDVPACGCDSASGTVGLVPLVGLLALRRRRAARAP